jgi:lipoprotein
MKKNMSKGFVWVAVLAAALLFAGCSDGTKEAENAAKAYLTAVSGFNLDVMEACLSEGKNEDFGIDTTVIAKDHEQTDTYKKAVESMFKALSGTVEYSIGQSEQRDKNTVVVNTEIRHADVNKEAVDQFMQQKMDEYADAHPELSQKTEIEQSDVGITVMADAYKTFLQTQNKISSEVAITLVRAGGSWKILNGEENRELKNLLTEIFGTF